MTALVAIIGAVLIVDQLQVLGVDELDLAAYQQKMLKVIVCAALPWLLLGGWLLNMFISFVSFPMRFASATYHWQCDAMVWFVLLAPMVNCLYFTTNALWIARLFFCVEKQAP